MASYLARVTATFGLLLCTACGRQQPSYRGHVVAEDACSVMQRQMPKETLRARLVKAQSGDLPAERDVWGYYTICDYMDQAKYWEDRLLRAGDADALAARSEELFQAAYPLKDADPRKLFLLKQSLDLEARYRKAVAGRVIHVEVNGKLEAIRFSGEPDEGTANMRKILARVEATQSK